MPFTIEADVYLERPFIVLYGPCKFTEVPPGQSQVVKAYGNGRVNLPVDVEVYVKRLLVVLDALLDESQRAP
ncbi:hypothetical protein MBAV_000490 [Candidatus Magnetobacterium bavaricum]|uniref:Uncharacterized protein n=1 Tax=Candidatus Magnetobacterium bavaricum TaxID=29290 RepID=A0A0F3GZE0_9BACT|nr:hypothetical protein MBAV_000490 [Candidatus Magnetobacterium bavaricum]